MTNRRLHVRLRHCALAVVIFLIAAGCSDNGGSSLADLAEPSGTSPPTAPTLETADIEAPDFSGRWEIIAYLNSIGASGNLSAGTASFEIVDGQIEGNFGCNSVALTFDASGPYKEAGAIDRNLRGQTVIVSFVSTTEIACEEPLATQEAQLALAFPRAQRWSVENDTFFLLGEVHNEIVAQRAS